MFRGTPCRHSRKVAAKSTSRSGSNDQHPNHLTRVFAQPSMRFTGSQQQNLGYRHGAPGSQLRNYVDIYEPDGDLEEYPYCHSKATGLRHTASEGSNAMEGYHICDSPSTNQNHTRMIRDDMNNLSNSGLVYPLEHMDSYRDTPQSCHQNQNLNEFAPDFDFKIVLSPGIPATPVGTPELKFPSSMIRSSTRRPLRECRTDNRHEDIVPDLSTFGYPAPQGSSRAVSMVEHDRKQPLNELSAIEAPLKVFNLDGISNFLSQYKQTLPIGKHLGCPLPEITAADHDSNLHTYGFVHGRHSSKLNDQQLPSRCPDVARTMSHASERYSEKLAADSKGHHTGSVYEDSKRSLDSITLSDCEETNSTASNTPCISRASSPDIISAILPSMNEDICNRVMAIFEEMFEKNGTPLDLSPESEGSPPILESPASYPQLKDVEPKRHKVPPSDGDSGYQSLDVPALPHTDLSDNVYSDIQIPMRPRGNHGEPHQLSPSSSNSTPRGAQIHISKQNHSREDPVRHEGAKKRKGESEDPDEDDDGGRKRQRPSNPPIADTLDDKFKKRNFACPYNKRNGTWKNASCIFPGWPSVSRVKEHLYRCHSLPVLCPRCYKQFSSDTERNEHLRAKASAMCDGVASPPTIEGFDEEQEKQLRRRSRGTGESGEDKWRAVYRILFPQDAEQRIPSPYLDTNWELDCDGAPSTSPDSETLARYDEFSKKELPKLVKEDVLKLIKGITPQLVELMTSTLPDIVGRAQRIIYDQFLQNESGEHPYSGESSKSAAEQPHCHNKTQAIREMITPLPQVDETTYPMPTLEETQNNHNQIKPQSNTAFDSGYGSQASQHMPSVSGPPGYELYDIEGFDPRMNNPASLELTGNEFFSDLTDFTGPSQPRDEAMGAIDFDLLMPDGDEDLLSGHGSFPNYH
ncbi:uncharacterized protein K452DRAFT_358323 [Aplosporella prunicola CBS 121167]|uniref:C2H2-type domain-containing protein n=1 Tax=Aplosporella prunicola CBS 121167 TaxID=1176127 RepID=A0A6A6BG76_9PEZI|nr:uncharacterized protein K452DRAFT_358323 [Aplosporella prunicola CBS 121167]KAF2142578.1 hypothetical protein K452DRAFT_358323 [Aplosporella prunicola CBS 121167]